MRISLLAVIAGFVAVDGAKDSHYYRPGFRNPNVDKEMYWRDAINVLQDLSYFKALYVSYHNCAWSAYSYNPFYAGQEYNYNENQNCGGDGDEQSNWYMGKTQCYRANAAFSLYGVLQGDDTNGEDACSSATFINSFMTTAGLEAFLASMQVSGLDIEGEENGRLRRLEENNYGAGDFSSYCYAVEPEDNQEEQNNQDDGNGNDDFVNYSGYVSYGIGCIDGAFVRQKFSGAFCHGHNAIAVVDTLDTLNSNIASAQCIQIFDGDNYEGNRDEDQDNQQVQNGEIEFDDAVELLKYSRACSVRDYPNLCPDPYRKVAGYARTIEGATRTTVSGDFFHPSNKLQYIEVILGFLFSIFGVCMVVASYFVSKRTNRAPRDTDGLTKSSDSSKPNMLKRTVSSVSSRASQMSTKLLDKLQNFAEEVDDDEEAGYSKAGSDGSEMEMASMRSTSTGSHHTESTKQSRNASVSPNRSPTNAEGVDFVPYTASIGGVPVGPAVASPEAKEGEHVVPKTSFLGRFSNKSTDSRSRNSSSNAISEKRSDSNASSSAGKSSPKAGSLVDSDTNPGLVANLKAAISENKSKSPIRSAGKGSLTSADVALAVAVEMEKQQALERSATPDTVPPPRASPKHKRSLSGLFSRRSSDGNHPLPDVTEDAKRSSSELSGFAIVSVEDGLSQSHDESADIVRPPAGLSKTASEEESIGELTKQSRRTECMPLGNVELPPRIAQVASCGSTESSCFGEVHRKQGQEGLDKASGATASTLDNVYSKATDMFTDAFNPFQDDVESEEPQLASQSQDVPEIEPAILRRTLSSPEPSMHQAASDYPDPKAKDFKRPRLAKFSKRVFSHRRKKSKSEF